VTKDVPTVRVAFAADAQAISDLLYEFNGEALLVEALAARMAQARGIETVFLGEQGGCLAGLLVLRTVPTLSGPEDWAEITELYVRPQARRNGVGRALVAAAIEHSRDCGCTEIHLLVDPANEGGLAFYRALGFHRDSWEMRRPLQEPV
jgi:ribosomal protein S18 acetylase RimI-like enzyme